MPRLLAAEQDGPLTSCCCTGPDRGIFRQQMELTDSPIVWQCSGHVLHPSVRHSCPVCNRYLGNWRCCVKVRISVRCSGDVEVHVVSVAGDFYAFCRSHWPRSQYLLPRKDPTAVGQVITRSPHSRSRGFVNYGQLSRQVIAAGSPCDCVEVVQRIASASPRARCRNIQKCGDGGATDILHHSGEGRQVRWPIGGSR